METNSTSPLSVDAFLRDTSIKLFLPNFISSASIVSNSTIALRLVIIHIGLAMRCKVNHTVFLECKQLLLYIIVYISNKNDKKEEKERLI